MSHESGSFSRRRFLQVAGAGAATLALAGCAPGGVSSSAVPKGKGTGWKQFSGTTINFITENTSPSSAIAANTKVFTDLTGINLKISQMELEDLVQKVKLDLSSGKSTYQVIYADPYQVLSPLSAGLRDLMPLVNDKQYPPVQRGLSDFLNLDNAGRFLSKSKLYAIPYDSATMMWHYRKDVFAKYHDAMMSDLGFDPTPSAKITWEQYYQIADWLNAHAKADVKYGVGCQAKQHDSLQCDFTDVLLAYGGNYFADPGIGVYGSRKPGKCTLTSPEAIAAATFYKKLVSVADPASTSWDWSGLGSAYAAGEVAMCANWTDFIPSDIASLKDKAGFSPLPTGPDRSANLWGGTGIGISANATGDELGAAWLFVNWATSPAAQIMEVTSKVGGGAPTRRSVFNAPQFDVSPDQLVETAPEMSAKDVILDIWKPALVGERPKIATWNQVDTVIYTELSKMLVNDVSPKTTMTTIAQQVDKINGL